VGYWSAQQLIPEMSLADHVLSEHRPFAEQIDKGLLLRALQIMRWLTIRRAEVSVFQHLQDRAQKMATLSVEKMERLVVCFLLTLMSIKNGTEQTKAFAEVRDISVVIGIVFCSSVR
jgi:hypothetical protein